MEKVGIGLDGQKTASLKDNEKLECRICCDEFTGEEAYALACNHFFCRGCWAAYLAAKVRVLRVRVALFWFGGGHRQRYIRTYSLSAAFLYIAWSRRRAIRVHTIFIVQ